MQRDLQHETMRIYKILVAVREDWGGKLILCCGPGCAQTGAPTAVNIAGGTTLAVDSDAAAMKSAMRAGYLDFVVNTLDEALRTLKNEIRQKRPLSVGLIANVETTLAEMVERGLQPDLQLAPSGCPDSSYPQLDTLRSRGMPCRSALGIEDSERLQECFFSATDSAALRLIDTALLAALPAGDTIRRRWIERAPKYLREARSGGRWTWLGEEELASFAEAGLSPAPQR
jgi:Urocanase Rossmann-like domain